MSEDRLNRIEEKLDKLTDIVASIARVEEKILASNKALGKMEERVYKAEADIDALHSKVRENSAVVNFANKAFWIVVTSAVGLVFYVLRG